MKTSEELASMPLTQLASIFHTLSPQEKCYVSFEKLCEMYPADVVEKELDARIEWLQSEIDRKNAIAEKHATTEHRANRWREVLDDPRWEKNQVPMRAALLDEGLYSLSTEEIFRLVITQPALFPQPVGTSPEMAKMIALGKRVIASDFSLEQWHPEAEDESVEV